MILEYRNLTRLEMEKVDKENTIVMIPIGALEQHGNQLPLGTDDMIAETLVEYIKCELEKDFPMLIFPLMPIGLSTEHRNFCGSITLKPQTLYVMLEDICRSLVHHGFKKIVFLNAHGGNVPVIQILSRELRAELGIGVFLIESAFWGNSDVKDTVSEGNIWEFHGGEMETSMIMAIDEKLVKLETAVPGTPTSFVDNKHLRIFGPISIGWVSEDWKDEDGNPIGIGGNPKGATAEKGEVIYKSFAKSIAEGLQEINKWDYRKTEIN